MSNIVSCSPAPLAITSQITVPALIEFAGARATNHYLEFFAARIRNAGTREAYSRAAQEFVQSCERHGLLLEHLSPLAVATYIELLCKHRSAPTVKLHLVAIRMLYDWLVTGHIVEFNPAASVRGPKHVLKKARRPFWTRWKPGCCSIRSISPRSKVSAIGH